ncbi:MAG: hypothetical protein KY454_12135 [Actinobacteria bacterium]|nr:hypothetical protein [Actinomycetota bacterium]
MDVGRSAPDELPVAPLDAVVDHVGDAVVDSTATRARTKLQRYLSPSLVGWALGP